MKKKKDAFISPIKGRAKRIVPTLSGANNGGFFTLYGIIILQITLAFTSTVVISIKSNAIPLTMDNTLACVEIYAIIKAKQDLLNYEEEEENIEYLGFDVLFVYDDITCFITISKEGATVLSSCLEWDDIDNVVVDYTYL